MAAPTRSRVVTMAAPTRSRVVTMAAPTRSRVVTMAAPTRSRVVTIVAPTRSRVVTMVAPTHSRVVTSQPNPPQCAALSFIFSASHPEHLRSFSLFLFRSLLHLTSFFSFTKNLLHQILFCQAISLQQVTVASSIYALIVFFFPKQLLCRHWQRTLSTLRGIENNFCFINVRWHRPELDLAVVGLLKTLFCVRKGLCAHSGIDHKTEKRVYMYIQQLPVHQCQKLNGKPTS